MQERGRYKPVSGKGFINGGAGAEQGNGHMRVMAFAMIGPPASAIIVQ